MTFPVFIVSPLTNGYALGLQNGGPNILPQVMDIALYGYQKHFADFFNILFLASNAGAAVGSQDYRHFNVPTDARVVSALIGIF
jgi:hypothetical protein